MTAPTTEFAEIDAEIHAIFFCSRYDNQIAIIAMLREQGATLELGENGKMWARVPAGSLTAEQIIGLKMCRSGLTHALRLSEGYCGVCGVVPATRPRPRWASEKCLFCEVCYWSTVNPILYRLGLTDTQRKRLLKAEAYANDLTMTVIEGGLF